MSRSGQSQRSATSGSTPVARRAGTNEASSVTTRKTSVTAANAAGSSGVTPKSSAVRYRDSDRRGQHAERQSCDRQPRALAGDHQQHLARPRAERHAHADFLRAPARRRTTARRTARAPPAAASWPRTRAQATRRGVRASDRATAGATSRRRRRRASSARRAATPRAAPPRSSPRAPRRGRPCSSASGCRPRRPLIDREVAIGTGGSCSVCVRASRTTPTISISSCAEPIRLPIATAAGEIALRRPDSLTIATSGAARVVAIGEVPAGGERNAGRREVAGRDPVPVQAADALAGAFDAVPGRRRAAGDQAARRGRGAGHARHRARRVDQPSRQAPSSCSGA